MALYTTPEKKKEGQENFTGAVGQTRRQFFKTLMAGGGGVAAGLGAAWYFGYRKPDKALKVGLIGAGDEGGVLTGFHNPEYTEIVAVSDIRPYNMWPDHNWGAGQSYWGWSDRIFRGDKNPSSPRKGLNKIYGKEHAKGIRRYVDYRKMLEDDDVDAVIIALPLHLHAPVAIEALKAKKHVFCEKLMARTVRQCKEMIQAARDNKKILAIGHQRHYSLLYQHALDVVKAGHLGELRHIRALWHRNNAWPKKFKDPKSGEIISNSDRVDTEWLEGSKYRIKVDGKDKDWREVEVVEYRDSWFKGNEKIDVDGGKDQLAGFLNGDKSADRNQYPFKYKSMEELVRWRLFDRTGGGLMAELGSHQLDACSIFLGKVKPLAVSGTGYKSFYFDDREVDDHVFTTFEFPGREYWNDGVEHGDVSKRDDVVVMTYSSINTNSFEPYGECLMGQEGTLTIEGEKVAALYPEKNPYAKKDAKGTSSQVKAAGATAADTSSTTGYADPLAQKVGQAVMGSGEVSRGYREELEDFAYVCKLHDTTADENVKKMCRGEIPVAGVTDVHAPKCHGVVAMADAIMALTANIAMATRQRIEFKKEWFEPAQLDATPENDYADAIAKAKKNS